MVMSPDSLKFEIKINMKSIVKNVFRDHVDIIIILES